MPLQGTIESFGISEIFQLIEHQGKTGTLQIRTGEGLAKLRFRDGRLIEAWPDKRSPAELIGARLVRAGLVTSVQLGHALEQQRQNMKRLGDLLTSMGAVRVADFQSLLALQHRETVYSVLQLKRGEFEFVTEAVEVEEGVSLPLEIGSLLMEGFRQIDEWPQLRKTIPSEKTVYGRVAEKTLPTDLEPMEGRMYGLIDGVATVREVVDRCRAGDFLGWQALSGLFTRGLITPVGATRRKEVAPQPIRAGRALDWAVGVGLCAAALAQLLLFAPPRLEAGREAVRAVGAARADAAGLGERAAAWGQRTPPEWPPPP